MTARGQSLTVCPTARKEANSDGARSGKGSGKKDEVCNVVGELRRASSMQSLEQVCSVCAAPMERMALCCSGKLDGGKHACSAVCLLRCSEERYQLPKTSKTELSLAERDSQDWYNDGADCLKEFQVPEGVHVVRLDDNDVDEVLAVEDADELAALDAAVATLVTVLGASVAAVAAASPRRERT